MTKVLKFCLKFERFYHKGPIWLCTKCTQLPSSWKFTLQLCLLTGSKNKYNKLREIITALLCCFFMLKTQTAWCCSMWETKMSLCFIEQTVFKLCTHLFTQRHMLYFNVRSVPTECVLLVFSWRPPARPSGHTRSGKFAQCNRIDSISIFSSVASSDASWLPHGWIFIFCLSH